MAMKLLAHFNGAVASTAVTNSVSGLTMSGGGGFALSATQVKFGSTAADFSAGAYVQSGSDITLAGPFCLSFQLRRTSYTSSPFCIGRRDTDGGLVLDTYVNQANLQRQAAAGNVTIIGLTNTPFGEPNSGWVHVVINRDVDNVVRLIVDGAVLASVTDATVFSGKLTLGGTVAANGTTSGSSMCFMDEAMLDDASAFYATYPFAAPTGEYDAAVTPTGPTIWALLHMDGTPGSQQFPNAMASSVGFAASGGATIQNTQVAFASGGSSVGQFMPNFGDPDNHFSVTATRVSATSMAGLQAAINGGGNFRLNPASFSGGNLTVGSNTTIVGLPGSTFLPGIITIAPGSQNVTLLGFGCDGFNFPQSNLVTKNVTIGMIHVGQIAGTGCTVENLFVCSAASEVRFDCTTNGYVRNSRFHRPYTQGSGLDGKPGFYIWGNPTTRNCWNNTLSAIAPLGGFTLNIDISGHRDFSLIGWAAEDYDGHSDDTHSIRVRNTTRFNALGFSGRNGQTSGLYSDADYTNVIFSDFNADAPNTQLDLGANAAVASMLDYRKNTPAQWTDAAPAGTRIRVTDDDLGVLKLNDAYTTPGGTVASAIQALFVSPLNNSVAHALPTWRTIFEPLGANWQAGLAGRPDETAYLQGLIDSGLIHELEARAYYTSAPLLVGSGGVLIGVAGQTVICSKNPGTHSIIETKFNAGNPNGGTGGFSLFDIVLQGGTWGIRQAEPGPQLNGFHWIGVTFLDMTVAAHGIDNSFAWDNGFIAKCKYKRCAQVLKQIGTSVTNTEPTIAYIDKINWVFCYAEDCGKGWCFNSTRANNLDALYACYARNFTTGGMIELLGGNNEHVAILCVAENMGGPVAIRSTLNKFFWTGGRVVGSASNTALFSNNATVEGSYLDKGAGNALVFELQPEDAYATWARPHIHNCVSTASLGNFLAAPTRMKLVMANNQFPATDIAGVSKPLSAISYDGKGTISVDDDARNAQLAWIDGAILPGTRFNRDDGVTVAGSGAAPGQGGMDGTTNGMLISSAPISLAGPFCITFRYYRKGNVGKIFGIGRENVDGGLNLGTYVNTTTLSKFAAGAAVTVLENTATILGNDGPMRHVVVNRDSANVIRFIVDGTVIAQATDASTFTGLFTLGNVLLSSGVPMGGAANAYFDELLVCTDDPIYTTFPFTPPTSAYTYSSAAQAQGDALISTDGTVLSFAGRIVSADATIGTTDDIGMTGAYLMQAAAAAGQDATAAYAGQLFLDGTAASTQDATVDDAGGAIISAVWAMDDNLPGSFISNVLSSGDADATVAADAESLFVGTQLISAVASIDAPADAQLVAGRTVASVLVDAPAADVSPGLTLVRAAQAASVNEALVSWSALYVPGETGDGKPAPLLRRMRRESNPRKMTR